MEYRAYDEPWCFVRYAGAVLVFCPQQIRAFLVRCSFRLRDFMSPLFSCFCSCFCYCLWRIAGEIPPELGRLSKLEELLVNSNAFSGEWIPCPSHGLTVAYAVIYIASLALFSLFWVRSEPPCATSDYCCCFCRCCRYWILCFLFIVGCCCDHQHHYAVNGTIITRKHCNQKRRWYRT